LAPPQRRFAIAKNELEANAWVKLLLPITNSNPNPNCNPYSNFSTAYLRDGGQLHLEPFVETVWLVLFEFRINRTQHILKVVPDFAEEERDGN